MLVPNNEETLRFGVDFLCINAVTIPNTYPLPGMDDCIDSLGEANMFENLNVLPGYLQVPITDEDKKKKHLLLTLALTATNASRFVCAMRQLRSNARWVLSPWAFVGKHVWYISTMWSSFLEIIASKFEKTMRFLHYSGKVEWHFG